MLNAPTPLAGTVTEPRPEELSDRMSLLHMLKVIWRRRGTILLAATIALALALSYLLVATPVYTASARVITDVRRPNAGPAPVDMSIDPAVVESQIAAIKSESLALTVINKLDLRDDPEFTSASHGSILGDLRTNAAEESDSRSVAEHRVVDRFIRALNVIQIGRSYIADVQFRSTDPEKAARVANALAESYIDDQLEARTSAAMRGALWLELRVNEMRRQANEAAKALEGLKSRAAQNLVSNPEADGELRSLEAALESYKRSQEVFQNMHRYSQAAQQQSLPVTEARILSPALPPLRPTYPRAGLILILSALTGCGFGIAAALGREYLDRTIRSPYQLEHDLGIRYLGSIQLLKGRHLVSVGKGKRAIPMFGTPVLESLLAFQFIEADERACSIIGITSARRAEGKSTIAFNVAHAMASIGKRALLIDADLRNSSLSGLLAPASGSDLSGALNGSLQLTDINRNKEYGFCFLPHSPDLDGKSAPEILSSAHMRSLLTGAKTAYDCVILDLPSMLGYIDVPAIANLLDGVILVTEWGRTKIEDLEHIVVRFPRVTEHLIGAFINKEDFRAR